MKESTFYILLSIYIGIIGIYGYIKVHYDVYLYDKGSTLSNRLMLLPTLIISLRKDHHKGRDWEIVFAFLNKRWYIAIHSFKTKNYGTKQKR